MAGTIECKGPHTCPYCDTNIAEAQFPDCEACDMTLLRCPKCLWVIPKDTKKCPHCGAAIPKQAAKGG